METILEGVVEVGGVTAAMVLDGNGRVVAHRGRAVHDRATCEQVGGRITKAIESIALQQEDWETITAQFTDGKLLVRKLGATGAARRNVLAVVADSSLNASFATVAIRVAANKLRVALESAPPTLSRTTASAPPAPPSAPAAAAPAAPEPRPQVAAAASQPALAKAGLSWSTSSIGGSSVAGVSGVAVADAASSAFLTRCTKELARHVGPMSKVYVQEAVRRVAPDAPFSLARAKDLRDDLAGQIEDSRGRAQFLKAVEKA
jgi:hypothetical protein